MRAPVGVAVGKSVGVALSGSTRSGGGADGIPRTNLLWYAPISNGLVDTIGLSISDYPALGPKLQPIFFTDPNTLIASATAVPAALASTHCNRWNLLGVVDKIVVIYDMSASFSTIVRARRYARIATPASDQNVPEEYATVVAAMNAIAVAGSPIIISPGTHIVESLAITFTLIICSRDINSRAEINAVTGARPIALKGGCHGSQLIDLIIHAGTGSCLTADSTGTAIVTAKNCDFLSDGGATGTIGLQGPGFTFNVIGGVISSANTEAMTVSAAANIYLNRTTVTVGTTNYGIRHDHTNAATVLDVRNCTITSNAAVATIAVLQTAATVNGRISRIISNPITATQKNGRVIWIGSETSSAADGYLNDYIISDNTITGTKGQSGDDDGTNHGIFPGFNVNGQIVRNTTIGVGYGVVWKGTGLDNTTGFVAYNVLINANIALRIKGIDGAILVNNTGMVAGASSVSALYLSDNDATGTGNNVVNVNNVYVSLTTGKNVAVMDGVCSFAQSAANCYICLSLSSFAIGGVGKTWAEWVAANGEAGSFCIVKNGSDYDVYTAAAPTTVASTLSYCPIDILTGRIVDAADNPLIEAGLVVAGINDNGELDCWDNATSAAPNIGADQG